MPAPDAPSGAALRFTTADATGSARLASTEYAGTPLAAIFTLSYRTKRLSPGSDAGQLPALNIEVQAPNGYLNLVWEPVYSDRVRAEAAGWKRWDPAGGAAGWRENKV
ncbi:MAG: hypothetical protein H7323_15490, partial [Frankiales bacterium]|nr:hypothetical protein [Frankiales bacterium]